jgi:hypothetical protein
MNLEQAEKKSFKLKWVKGKLHEKSSVSVIKCEPPIYFNDLGEMSEYYPMTYNEIEDNIIDYIINLHNKSLQENKDKK